MDTILSEALLLSATGTSFVFIFLGLLVVVIKAMSWCSKYFVVDNPNYTEKLENKKTAAVVASVIHHQRIINNDK